MASWRLRPRPWSSSLPHFGIQPPSAAEPEPRQQDERPVRRGLAKDAKIADVLRLSDEGCKALVQQLGDCRPFRRIANAAGERQVKAPLVEDIGVTPAFQQFVLTPCQTHGPTAGQLALGGWPAECIELDDALV